MSYKLTPWAWELALPLSAKIVLVRLADQANDDGHCWPSVGSIAATLGVTERWVRGLIASLETQGHIKRVSQYRSNGSQASTLYLVGAAAIARGVDLDAPRPRRPVDNSRPPGTTVPPPPERGFRPPRNYSSAPGRKYGSALEPSIRTERRVSARSAPAAAAPDGASSGAFASLAVFVSPATEAAREAKARLVRELGLPVRDPVTGEWSATGAQSAADAPSVSGGG